MILREEQIAVLQEGKREDFIARLMEHFAKLWPERVRTIGSGYKKWVEKNVDDAEGYGLTTEEYAARYVNLCFVWGAGFPAKPEHEWALEILTDEERSQTIKILQVVHETELRLPSKKDLTQ